MRVFDLVTRTEIDAFPVVDGQTGRLCGFQLEKNGPIWPTELFKIPFAPDWEEIKHNALMAVLPGVAARQMQSIQGNSRVNQMIYPNEEAIVQEAMRIAEAIANHIQEKEKYFSPGVEAIKRERQRQVIGEGYDEKHDEQHDPKVFLEAAISYFMSALGRKGDSASEWPFEKEFYKPKDFKRDVERGAALAAAGLDLFYKMEVKKKDVQKLKVGDTLVFDHSDYTDYCIVYWVNDEGTEGKMACVDDGGGTDCMWLFNVVVNDEGHLTTYQDREVRRDPELLDRVHDSMNIEGDGLHFETLLVSLFEQAAYTPQDVTLYLEDDMDEAEELVLLKKGFEDILKTSKKFNEKLHHLKS